MSGNTSADEAAIRTVMSSYEAALNASDTQGGHATLHGGRGVHGAEQPVGCR
jgi:hypothetical protein